MENFDIRVRAIPLFARMNVGVSLGSLEAYAGIGAGALFSASELESDLTSVQSATSWRPSGIGLVGLAVPIGLGVLLVEAHYWYAQLEETYLSGSLGGANVSGGFGVAF